MVSLMKKNEELTKRLQGVEEIARSAKDQNVRFFGQVAVDRLLGFNEIPAGSVVLVDLACVQARRGVWLPLSLPGVYATRTDPVSASTVSDPWLCTYSIDTATLQVQQYWVRAVAEDGKTPAFSLCTFRPS